jgi:hypothetical protein
MESPWYVYKWYVDNFITFPESLRSLCLDVWIFSYEFLKSQVWICLNLDISVVLALLTLLSVESCLGESTKVVEHFLSFPESSSLLFLD